MSLRKTAFITGITGQDGSYLADLLLWLGYEVHGLVRRSSSFNTGRIDYLAYKYGAANLHLHHGDLLDTGRINSLLSSLQPDEIYNLGAQSHVRVSFDIPSSTAASAGLGLLTILEAAKMFCPSAKIYQASSSELFGATEPPQSESSAFQPQSPYAIAKLFAYWTARNFRDAADLFVSNGILFNHESPRRGETFVTRKITRGLARIVRGETDQLALGNLDSRRDWGYAPEYVVAMWKMLQLDTPTDLVIGTGKSLTVRAFLEAACEFVGLKVDDVTSQDARLLRPTEVDSLIADPSKAEVEIGWTAQTSPIELANLMMKHDLEHRDLFVDDLSPTTWESLLSR